MTWDQAADSAAGEPRRKLPLKLLDLFLIAIFGVVGVQVAVVIAITQGWMAPLGGDGSISRVLAAVAILALQAAGLLAIVLAIAKWWRGITWRELGFRRADSRWYVRACVVVVAGIALSGINTLVIEAVLGEVPQNPQLQVIAPDGFSWLGLIGMTLVAGCLVPIVEEITFRAVLYRWLRERIGFWPGLVLSSVLFGMLHGVLFLAPVLSILGALFAWLYERSGSLWPAIVAHGLFNTVMVVGVYVTLAAGYPVA
ncbi:MAG: CPBP family intramembrane glutamic endopeptidase [Rhodovibrionaceae bacterium]|nr:CPBP family intramembrane glutamic endopeptidase [Rhodovibrionaceae bacterium]